MSAFIWTSQGPVYLHLTAPLMAIDLQSWFLPISTLSAIVLFCTGAMLVFLWMSFRSIHNNEVGIVEKLWSFYGSVPEGSILALTGEAGYQSQVLRGGIHFGWWRWQYVIHRVPLVSIPQGQIGYVYARDGDALSPSQTLARAFECHNFQDAGAFLIGRDSIRGQRGRQRAILREGTYAVNLALFVVITEDRVFTLNALQSKQEAKTVEFWQTELSKQGGFGPAVIGGRISVSHGHEVAPSEMLDGIGIVTVHDGPAIDPGEIIAPMVGSDPHADDYHNNFQDPDAFLKCDGRRGRQYQTLTDGTYFINRWFATVDRIPKTVVPIGFVGVVVSYFGRVGQDVSGTGFRHGERVREGDRGVCERPYGPGKYAFNTYAGSIVLVPTTNFVLHWVTGRSEAHRYDESLRSIDLVTKDAYEPLLPLSVVVHIDYERAPNVIQRFGDVQKLITQTLDPLLSAYFRDVAHKRTMLELLHMRDEIQNEARAELRRRFHEFDIECVDVLIGKPSTNEIGGKIETLLDQLRMRQLSKEQVETYEHQRIAAEKQRAYNDAQAQAAMQTQLTNARLQVQISESAGEADLVRSRKQAEQTVVMADAELSRARRQAEQTVVLAEATSKQLTLEGLGESEKVLQIGRAEAAVLQQKIASFTDPRLYALSGLAEQLSHSSQPLVPERVFIGGGADGAQGASATSGLVGLLLSLLVAEKVENN